jgi:DNA-binding response OmpR family regulator
MTDTANNPGDPEAHSVLLVEDEVLIRMSVAEYLRDCGYRVIEAGNADEAVKVLNADAAIDVVCSDVQMPGTMDGFGLAQWVRRERVGLKIILVSGVRRAAEAAGDLCDGGPLMAKPYGPDELERRIRILLANQQARGTTPQSRRRGSA